MTVQEPPIVYVSQSIKAVGVLNRSISTGDNKIIDVIDQGLTGEGPKLDLEGSIAAVQGCHDELTRDGRFEKITLLEDVEVESPGQGLMPAAMSWDEVEKICLENDIQMLFVLEMYDTDLKIDYSQKTVNKSTPLGDVPMIEHHAVMTTKINSGWRMYDPSSKTIIDQFFMRDDLVSRSKGINPMIAAQGLIGRKEAVKEISNNVGHDYALRIRSLGIRVRREYFTKGNDQMKIANRRALVNDWDGAAELWEKQTDNSKRKVAGRACFNMAVIYEIEGDLDQAIEWAQKSYTDYNIKDGRDYTRLLRKRKARVDQMRQFHENGGE